jgi:hypothetical protein
VPELFDPSGLPRVIGVLLIDDLRRTAIAKAAVNSFFFQTYPNKSFLIVNTSGMMVTNRIHADCRELMWDAPESFDVLWSSMVDEVVRYYGPDAIVVFWPDDSYSHPSRLAMQLAQMPGPNDRSERVTALTHELRIDHQRSLLAPVCPVGGVVGTTMAWVCVLPTVVSTGTTSVDEVLSQLPLPVSLVPADPQNFPGCVQSIRFWHSLNTLRTREEFFGEFVDPRFEGVKPRGLCDEACRYLEGVLTTSYRGMRLSFSRDAV